MPPPSTNTDEYKTEEGAPARAVFSQEDRIWLTLLYQILFSSLGIVLFWTLGVVSSLMSMGATGGLWPVLTLFGFTGISLITPGITTFVGRLKMSEARPAPTFLIGTSCSLLFLGLSLFLVNLTGLLSLGALLYGFGTLAFSLGGYHLHSLTNFFRR